MGDSDEEYDRRRGRDKFRRERNDYDRRDDRRGNREPWDDRGREPWNRKRDRRDSYHDYDRARRERYSPPARHDISPPQYKRIRRDWDEGGGGGGGGGGFPHYDAPFGGGGGGGGGGPMHGPPPHAAWGPGPGDMAPPPQQHHFNSGQRTEAEVPTQPQMSTFKLFLAQQDDNITDEEAIKKYNEYKLDFKKQQINEFFLAHKEEEWFRSKYHPEECGRRMEDSRHALQHRCNVFMKLMSMSRVDEVSVDLEKYEELVKLLDAAVILIEGGTDFDLQVLDEDKTEEKPEEESRSRNNSESQSQPTEKPTSEISEEAETKDVEKEEEEGEEGEEGEDEERDEPKEEEEEGTGNHEEPEPIEQDIPPEKDEEEKEEAIEPEEKKKEQEETPQEPEPEEEEEKNSNSKRRKNGYDYQSGSESDTGGVSDSDSEPDNLDAEEPPPPGMEGESSVVQSNIGPFSKKEDLSNKEAENEDEEKETDTKGEEGETAEDPKPRGMHLTSSIFLRNLAPTITKQEVEAMCKRYPGFMRVALQDPMPERKFFRRGWVTFDRTVNIKDICWNLNNIRLRDCEMGAIVNRELKQRIRPISGIAAHKQIAKQDIKHCAKIIQNFDERWGLWQETEEEKKDEKKEPNFGLVSKNPVLKNITDYLVDEGSFEEDCYLGESLDEKPKEPNPEVTIERDDELLMVLDRMVLYLRIVHSYDYYSSVEYPNEDEMPHRCGIMHGRGGSPPNRITQNDVNEWIGTFDGKIQPFINLRTKLTEEEAIKLGKKDTDAEVEKFITANTQELAKDKWLCPLSGKKFKGPEFVRKHIFNKHDDKVDEVRQEVAYFNNYLMDPKRPQLIDHPGNKGSFGHHGGYQGPPQGHMMYNHRPQMMFHGNRRGNRRGGHGPGPFRSHFNRGHEPYRDRFPAGGRRDRSRPDPRGIIEYRDLDAPDDVDIF